MKEAFEKIKERLEEETYCPNCSMYCADANMCGFDEMRKQAIEIVNQVAEEYKVTMSQVNDEYITLPKVAFDRMISRMESESERDIYEEESLFINVRDAARIVRGIAEEYSNDFCEWHKVKNGNAYQCNTHAEIHDSRVLDWYVCPYCGKEIKIAPYQPKGE